MIRPAKGTPQNDPLVEAGWANADVAGEGNVSAAFCAATTTPSRSGEDSSQRGNRLVFSTAKPLDPEQHIG